MACKLNWQTEIKLRKCFKLCYQEFKRKVDRELEEKNKLLSSNPALLQLYKDLVMTEVVTSEEFWSQHAQQYTQKQNQPPQDIGVSGAFLADIKPQTDGCNGLKYNITPDIIECIFKTYPAVKKKYSHYFHRDRKYAESKDLFTECGKIDDQEMKRDIQGGVNDPLVNLTEFDDTCLDEGYGTLGEKSSANTGTVSQAMIKRFNQHSIMVLKATKNKANESPAQNGTDPKAVERYLHGPMPDTVTEYLNPNEASSTLKGILLESKQWIQWTQRHPSNTLVSPAAAVGVLGGAFARRGAYEELVPPDIEKEVRNLYLALCELLNHFWRCFPPVNSNAETKLVKMHEALNRFHTVKLKPFEDKLLRELSPLSHHLTKHLNQLLNAAYQKFNNWQKLKGR
ncbi:hypothetical protein NQ317_004521 [Molorchus minor]|uniref:BSD domain-containing protein n=1 Tax=Molorchus minor TaxID=1323400 RepID=A0ABQ9JWK1_9CUCU|nr:hypothetical protein NQ317_004521 [Molorchus minor]